jgi:glyoxylase I family protein
MAHIKEETTMSPDRPSAISHVGLCVRDLERSLRFYRDIVGLRVTKDEAQDVSGGFSPHLYHDRHARRRIVYLRYGDGNSVPFLALTEHPGDTITGTPIKTDQLGISHVAFTVPNVEEMTRRLLDHGVQPCGPTDAYRDAKGRIKTVYFFDPDGILVQFDEGW